MKTITTRRVGQLVLSLSAAFALGGCAVYGPPPAYYSDGGGVVYAAPPPVYVAPPVYVGPPVFLGFGFRSWGGRGYYRGGGGWYGGRGHGRWR